MELFKTHWKHSRSEVNTTSLVLEAKLTFVRERDGMSMKIKW